MSDTTGFNRASHDLYRPRFDAGESLDDLAIETGLSRVTMWRRLGRPARYLVREGIPPSPAFVAWTAGFFDGEGTVHIGYRARVTVIVAQTVPEPLEAIQVAFGGNVRVRTPATDRHKTVWTWRVGGTRAMEFLRLVRPMLRVKGPVTDLALACLARPPVRGRRLSVDEIAERNEVFLTAKALNHRGRAD